MVSGAILQPGYPLLHISQACIILLTEYDRVLQNNVGVLNRSLQTIVSQKLPMGIMVLGSNERSVIGYEQFYRFANLNELARLGMVATALKRSVQTGIETLNRRDRK